MNLNENIDTTKYTNQIKNIDFYKLLDRIEYYTDQNYHTDNLVLIAMRFGSEEDIENAKYILKRHNEERCMTQDLSKFRDYIFENIFSKMDISTVRKVKSKL